MKGRGNQAWHFDVNEQIVYRLDEFYQEFYEEELHSVGEGYRLEPCPMCGHKNCCSVGEPGINCFSCGWSGSHTGSYIDYAINRLRMTEFEAEKKLSEWSGVPVKELTEEESLQIQKQSRMQEIQKKAEVFYHETLLNCTTQYRLGQSEMTPLSYLINIRGRKMETVKKLMFGFSQNYLEFQRELLSQGYTADEIKDAHVWIPEGLFVFFYKDPITKDITRINTKNPFKATIKTRDELGEVAKESIIEGYSVGKKEAFYYTPGFSFKKPIIIVEGEHDLAACYENGGSNVCCVGGNLNDDYWGILEKAQSTIFTAFDNDETGLKYLGRMNDALPEKDIRKIGFPLNFKDIDEYYTQNVHSVSVPDLCKEAQIIETEKFKVTHSSFKNWKIENRFKKLEFDFYKQNDKGQVVGTANLFVDGKLKDRCDTSPLVSMKASMKPMNFMLDDEINAFFNTKLYDKSNDELISIFPYSSCKGEIKEILAKRIIESGEQDEIIVSFREKLKDRKDCDDIIDGILKEVNDIQNRSIASFDDIPKMRITQYFNVRNNDAYFYFTNVKHDGEAIRKLPYLLRNDRATIRLDLYKRKDEQCLLLIDNKYELPVEQPTALQCSSLTQKWAEAWVAGEIPVSDLNPFHLVSTIENYIRRFYYTNDENIYKVLALYCYMTYYYEVLGEVPYLYLNGEKGSGKSILDNVLSMFCFNAKMGVSISESSLFRMTSIEGGTIILDEIENLTSRTKANDSLMGAILKGGYTKNSFIYRMNMDKGCVEGFDSFGPKIISNIFGLEDVVLDRCIQINTYRLKITKDTRMEDPRHYLSERMAEIKEVTSKCCLSALEKFQELYEIFRSQVFEAETARLSQILTSMLAVAKLVDKYEETNIKSNAYEDALRDFYNLSIKSIKQDTEETTPEGIIKTAVPIIAQELKGIIPPNECNYTVPAKHKYHEQIEYNLEEGWFRVNTIHFKCFIEESMPGEQMHTRYIPRYVKSSYNIKDKDYKRRSTTIDNEDLIKEYKGNISPKVIYYTFYFRDFVDDDSFVRESHNEVEMNTDVF